MLTFVFSLVLVFSLGVEFSNGEYDSHFSNNLRNYPDLSSALQSDNFYLRHCTYHRQCDDDSGYVCREGICKCKFGRPDTIDGFKCKVQVKLGDFCKEFPRSKRDPRNPVYIRRKCPHNSECNKNSGICECGPLFQRRDSGCIPKILHAGDKTCRDHFDCMVQRGQQCYNGTCIECALGGFKGFRPSAKWVVAQPECTCFDKLSDLQENGVTPLLRHLHPLKASCEIPISSGDHCTISRNCKSSWTPHLICQDGICSCPPGSIKYRSISTQSLREFCILPINSPCTDDRDCHGPTAYCETRLEIPMCKCRDGYELQGQRDKNVGKDQFQCGSRFHEEVCGKFFPQDDKLRDQLKSQRLSCIQGIYECARPREMFWDIERGKCVSLVGGRCDLDLYDVSGCGGISRCWEYKSLGEYRCQCPLQDEEEDNNITSDINIGTIRQEQGPVVRLLGLRGMVRYKPTRDRRTCVRED